MSSSSHLREGDVDAMLGLLEDAQHDDPGEAFPWELLRGLLRLIPCDSVTHNHNNYVRRWQNLYQSLDDEGNTAVFRQEEPDLEAEPFWQLFWGNWSSYPLRTGDWRSVIMTTDFLPTAHQRAGDPITQMLGVSHELIVPLPATVPGDYRGFVLSRAEDRAFTERDRQVAALLRPHIQEIWLDAERRRGGLPKLTAREWQVLGMAGAGLSYADIASALFVSVATVRKHMEHVRERLGVHSAMAAAYMALPHAPVNLMGPHRESGTGASRQGSQTPR